MAKRRRKRIASRGSVNNIILKTLVNGDKYGYEIIKEVEEYSDGKISLKQPSLYSSLSRFEDKKFVSSYWQDSDIGGRRHYYHLTELGMQYYKKHILKESDEVEEDIEDEDIIEDNNENNEATDLADMESALTEFNESEEDDNDSSLQVEESLEEEEFNENEKPADHPTLTEIDEDEIPAIADFESDTTEPEAIISDHQFHTITPLEAIADSNELNHNDSQLDIEEEQPIPQDNVQPWKILSDRVKSSNRQYAQINSNKLYQRKPKKEQRIVLDTDGIFKLRDDSYQPVQKPQSKPVIIDNVIKRSNTNTIYGYDEEVLYGNKTTNKQETTSELTDEERQQKNENFLAKFNLITKSKMKPVSSPVQPNPEPKKEDKSIDYRNKLSAIFDSNNISDETITNNTLSDDTQQHVEEPITNNLFNYVDEEPNTTESDDDFIFDDIQEDSSCEDKFVDFEPVEEFEVKKENKQYIEKISTYSTTSSQVKLTKYEHNTTPAVLQDKTFVLINKLKMVFGIVMTLIMATELIVSLLVFRNKGMILDNDMSIFIAGFVITGIFALSYILPYLINSNAHKANNFRFVYSFWFGILTFLISLVLIYCINALMGFELDNFKFFAVKLIVPAIMTFNFVLGPIILTILNKRQAFYD